MIAFLSLEETAFFADVVVQRLPVLKDILLPVYPVKFNEDGKSGQLIIMSV